MLNIHSINASCISLDPRHLCFTPAELQIKVVYNATLQNVMSSHHFTAKKSQTFSPSHDEVSNREHHRHLLCGSERLFGFLETSQPNPLATISNSDRLLRPITFLIFNVFANENNELSYSGVLQIQMLSTSCPAYYNIIHMSKRTYSFRSLMSERSQMLWLPVNAVFLVHTGKLGTGKTDP